MGAPGLTSPIRSETFENLQLNAGMFLKNFSFSSITSATALKAALASAITAGTGILGCTRGGGSFTVTREIRTPEVDGRRYAFKGDKFVDSMDAYLSTTLIEMTPETWVAAFGTAASAYDTGRKVQTITVGTAIDADDYIDSLCWVGDLADGRYVLIELANALNTSDITFTFADKGEGTLPVEFHAHQSDVLDYDTAPFKIVYFSDTAAPSN